MYSTPFSAECLVGHPIQHIVWHGYPHFFFFSPLLGSIHHQTAISRLVVRYTPSLPSALSLSPRSVTANFPFDLIESAGGRGLGSGGQLETPT